MPEDICLWPDGVWCYLYELADYTHKSDDYRVIPFSSKEWALLVNAEEEGL